MTRYTSAFAALMFSAAPVMAQVPTVATDIAPIHSLVAQVMGDLGAPTLLMEKGASPHNYAMRPSEAKNLQRADVVFWTGDALAPWLGEAISTLAPNAVSEPLIELDAGVKIEFREGLTFEDHDHEDGEGHDHDEDHHDDHDEHQDHDEHEGHDDHDHSGIDPHAWLDPQNAIVWLDFIAKTLSDLDGENAQIYADNAAEGAVQLTALIERLQEQLADEHDIKFVVFHDAYHYFEARFGLSAMGAISLGDAAAPSPARISELQTLITEKGVDCVLSEPQFNAGLVKTLLAGTSAHSGVIDPLGQGIEAGPDFYAQLIQGVADSFDACR